MRKLYIFHVNDYLYIYNQILHILCTFSRRVHKPDSLVRFGLVLILTLTGSGNFVTNVEFYSMQSALSIPK